VNFTTAHLKFARRQYRLLRTTRARSEHHGNAARWSCMRCLLLMTTTQGRVTLIHNANAGDQRHDRAALLELLEYAGYRVSYFATKDTDLAEALGHRAELVVTAGDDRIIPSFVARARTDAPGSIVPSLVGLADAKRVERDRHLDRAAAVVVPGFGLKSATSSRQPSRRWSHVAAGLTDMRQIGPTQTAARRTTALCRPWGCSARPRRGA
jgi:hypothetical protein